MNNYEIVKKGECKNLIKCENCRHLAIVNDGKVYAICNQTDFEFMPFGTDTRIHFCAYGEKES